MMAVTFDRSATPGVLRLAGEIDIAGAAELRQALLEALAAGEETRLSLEAATGIDVTAVQLLWAAEREAKAGGAALALEGPVPEALRAAVRAAGFERFPLSEEAASAGEARA
jgi:anti-anti-sigma factor